MSIYFKLFPSASVRHELMPNVPLVGDGWGKKSQLFEPKTIKPSANYQFN